MKKLLITLFIALAIVSCKGSDTRGTSGTTAENNTLGGLTIPGIKNFSPAEIIIGKRICLALKYKREKMNQMTDMAEKFAFTGTWKACNMPAPLDVVQYIVSISNATADLRYVPATNSTHSISDVVTDTSEPVQTICSNMIVSGAVSNFVQFGGGDYFFKIYNISGYDTYELAKRAKNSKGQYSLTSTQVVSVITSATANLDIKSTGIEKFRTLNTTCPGNSDYASIGHTWMGATTAYKLPTE